MTFEVIYDFADEYPHFYSLILLAISLSCYWYSCRKIRKERRQNPTSYSAYVNESIVGPFLAGCFFLLAGCLTLKPKDYLLAKTIYGTPVLKQTIGYITNYSEKYPGRHKEICFVLNGLKFEFANNRISYGCGYSDISRARIADSTLVRIFYFTDAGSHTALRIECFK